MLKNRLILFGLLTFCLIGHVEAARPQKAYAKTSTVGNRPLSAKAIEAQETKLVALVNQERKRYGLLPLAIWSPLTYHARQHSQSMANGSVDFGHAGFEQRAQAIQKKARCHSVGENVAYCFHVDDPLITSVDMWIKSPHHCENMMGDYRETGIGIVYDHDGRCYLTQLFSKRVSN